MRVGQHQPRQRDLLGLGIGERATTGSDDRVETVRAASRTHGQRVDRVERLADVVVGRAGRRGQREVLAQRPDEHVVLLGDQRDVSAQLRQRQLDEADAADASPRPVRGGWMPASNRPSVDLPAPEGPTIAIRSPGATSRSTPCSTSRPST